jgi:hypothetical protein
MTNGANLSSQRDRTALDRVRRPPRKIWREFADKPLNNHDSREKKKGKESFF